MARRDDLAKLRGRAAERGYTLERAIRRNCWRLVNAKGETVVNPRNGSTAFSVVDAMGFLRNGQFAKSLGGGRYFAGGPSRER